MKQYKNEYEFCENYKHISVAGDSNAVVVRIPGTAKTKTGTKSVSFPFEKYDGWENACQQALEFRNFVYKEIGYVEKGVNFKNIRFQKRRSTNTGYLKISRTEKKNGSRCVSKIPVFQYSIYYMKDGIRKRKPRVMRIKGNENNCLMKAVMIVRKNRLEFANGKDNLEDLYPIRSNELEEIFDDFKIKGDEITLCIKDLKILFELIYPRIYDIGFFPEVSREAKSEIRGNLLHLKRSLDKLRSKKGMYEINGEKWFLKERYVHVSSRALNISNGNLQIPLEDLVITI